MPTKRPREGEEEGEEKEDAVALAPRGKKPRTEQENFTTRGTMLETMLTSGVGAGRARGAAS